MWVLHVFSAQIVFKHWKDLVIFYIHLSCWISFIIIPKVSYLISTRALVTGLWDVTSCKCLETQHLRVCIVGVCSGGFDEDLLPRGSDMEILKDRLLPVNKIFFFLKRASYFAFYKKKNYLLNKDTKNSLDYQWRVRESHLETVQILISIQDLFSAIGHSNYYLPR